MRHFIPSLIITVSALALATVWTGWQGLVLCALLVILQVSFSFDNAVVNAVVLKGMDRQWQKRFLTWGMIIAVFGMHYLFPLLIVAFATSMSLPQVMLLALADPVDYHRRLMTAHVHIAAFGGMFLLMVFLNFIFDESRDRHWLGRIEKHIGRVGHLEAVEIIVALGTLLILQGFLPDADQGAALAAGVFGVLLYVALGSITALFGLKNTSRTPGAYAGLLGFIYLNMLDASFSLDAVVGAFAITNDIIIIMLGLSAGAMFVRSLTVQLVRKGTLERYVFLEHGAHYAIGALAVIMLASTIIAIPEILTGLIGVAFVGLALWSSVRHNQRKSPPKRRSRSRV